MLEIVQHSVKVLVIFWQYQTPLSSLVQRNGLWVLFTTEYTGTTLFVDQSSQGRIQFLVDAVDRAVSHRQQLEMEAIINRFPIDLELELGANFTERTTYTGIYNISGLGFDMSFRVQCSENYYGPNCTTVCEPVEGGYTCDSEGRVVCNQDNRDPATNCTTCLGSGYDPQQNCTQCLLGRMSPWLWSINELWSVSPWLWYFFQLYSVLICRSRPCKQL